MSQTKKHCEPLVAAWLRPSTTEPCICCKQVAEKPRGEHLKNDVCMYVHPGGYSGVKRIGMTVGNPRNYPKNTNYKSHKNLCTLKHIPWSKTNLKNTVPINWSLLKKHIQKICTHDDSKFLYPK